MTEAVKAIKRKSKIRASGKDKAFLFFVYLFLTLSLLVVLLPLIYVVSASFSDSKAVVSGEVWLLPVRPTLKGYTAVFENPQIMTGFLNSFIYMFAGTAVSLVLTVLAAYPLSRGELAGKKLFNGLFLFTMLFSGGMIPSYILLRDLNMLNTRWAIIIPTALSVWNLIITRTYYQNTIPGDIYEAAYLDGCSDLRILFSIVIPLSGPILALSLIHISTEFLYQSGAKEVHIRPACPPLLYGCKYLNFSRSSSEMDLITRRVIREIEGENPGVDLTLYSNPDTPEYKEMLRRIGEKLNFTTLRYHRLDDMIESVGIEREKLCTYCWDGKE